MYTQKLVRSDKFKTGKDQYVDKDLVSQDNRDVFIGRLPVMVNSDLCWMKEEQRRDCEFDHGGYFLIKGAEKVSAFPSASCPLYSYVLSGNEISLLILKIRIWYFP